jgi:hypothetical protein
MSKSLAGTIGRMALTVRANVFGSCNIAFRSSSTRVTAGPLSACRRTANLTSKDIYDVNQQMLDYRLRLSGAPQ